MIDPQRLQHDFDLIAALTHTPGQGATRPTFSVAWGQAVQHVLDEAAAAGCVTWRDAAGNAFARPAAIGDTQPTWLIGSHLDTVPHGGTYDGVAGVLVALELLRSFHESQRPAPVTLVVFAEEEGPTFGLGMLGSRAWVGEIDAKQLGELRNAHGQSYLEAGQPFGVDAPRLAAARVDPARFLGFIELHAEQGPGMWRRDQRLAVVESIAGRRQYLVQVTGEANHAGATAMPDRRDALAAAAEMVLRLEALAGELSPQAVITVGRLQAQPNAVNVIADRVDFTIDFRAPLDDTLEAGDAQLQRELSRLAQARGVGCAVSLTESIAARPMDPALVAGLAAVGEGLPTTVSGALHDSAVLAPHLPTAMLFVPSRDGISHNPAEFSRVEDVAHGAEIVARFVGRPTLAQLNSADAETFVESVGGVFEHSPWIAERAAGRRPFDSVDALHAAMCDVVEEASDTQQEALINAHPDLVGRLAQQGRLTPESTREQRAAGLDAISPEEAQTFQRHNAAYREKFGFPFVICARENRKDAILAEMPRRLQHDRGAEIAAALTEIKKIARLRLADAIWPPG